MIFLKSAPQQDAKSLHDSVAATLRMFREDEKKKAKLAVDKERFKHGTSRLSRQEPGSPRGYTQKSEKL